MKRIIAAAVIAAIMAGSLLGCGAGQDQKPAAQSEAALQPVEKHFAGASINKMDGLRIDFELDRKWFVLRKSNTEPIIRIYAEAPTESVADALAQEVIKVING